MYLFKDRIAWRFYAHLLDLPTDNRSTLIRSYNVQVSDRPFAIRLATVLDSLSDFIHAAGEGRINRYEDVTQRKN
jgi:hypothetical protein